MKGSKAVINELNKNLKLELSAILQYITHSSMADNWGYAVLRDLFMSRAKDEMKHADMLIDKILFLEGVPEVSNIATVNIGKDVEEMHNNDKASERGAIESYNESIAICVDEGDNGTRKLLEQLLEEEENHINYIESEIRKIKDVGIENYLVEQF